MTDFELETWIVEVGGHVVAKRAAMGESALTPLEKLIHCLWIADYGMRNAGDLVTASELHATFQKEAAALALELGMPKTQAAFSLPVTELKQRFHSLSHAVVPEIAAKLPHGTPGG